MGWVDAAPCVVTGRERESEARLDLCSLQKANYFISLHFLPNYLPTYGHHFFFSLHLKAQDMYVNLVTTFLFLRNLANKRAQISSKGLHKLRQASKHHDTHAQKKKKKIERSSRNEGVLNRPDRGRAYFSLLR